MKIYNLVLNDYQFKESFLTNRIQFKGNPIRRITRPIERAIRRINPFRRGRDSGEEIVEQVQKIELILKDPDPDKDYLKLKEFGERIVNFNIRESIKKGFSTKDILQHFGIQNNTTIKFNINLLKNRKILWTVFGNDFDENKPFNLRMLEDKNYDLSFLPNNNDKGQLLYSFLADRIGKIDDFELLNGSAVSSTWINGIFEYIYLYYVETTGANVRVYKRLYKRAV
ncbi:hypothetical protein [Fusobacterium polymorphum]|uniref:Uncharacterized protein n=1 Tax=Fusobacterium nucleatum subsp. polymorphum TaxID=76857 RepID=A0A2C6BR28_FUSNP|nr:hypothetical protein [Fusobacterium polymorphum]PHI06681.1 hypothetical protein CBG54_06335 [Fusobacterium polymorphum]